MRFKVIVTYEYDVSSSGARNYDTTDPLEMAEVDRQAMAEDYGIISMDLAEGGYVVNVEPV
jgi:hypothetical protein